MATSLVSLVMQFLTPEMIGRVATALGLDRTLVQSAINAAVPGLLAGLGGVATQPGGAQKLAEAAKQKTGKLVKFADMLGGVPIHLHRAWVAVAYDATWRRRPKCTRRRDWPICRARSRQERIAVRDARSHRYGHNRATAKPSGSGREQYR